MANTLNINNNFAELVTKFNALAATVDSDLDFRNKISVTDAGGDGSLTYDTASGVITYTGPSATEVRAHLSVTDAGGDGSLSYDSATGVTTYTGPSASEVRAHLSAGDGIDFTSGEISISDDGVARVNLKDEVSLQILNSSGTILKTLYGAGS